MLHVSKLMPRGRGLAPVLVKRAATVQLDWDVRQKSRFAATDSGGRELGVFLPRGTLVRGGDVLVAEDGSLIRVEAAPQPVLRITPCAEHGSAFDLTRAAYHLGNRHVPIELAPDHLQIEPDHVLADMLRTMHLTVSELKAPFEPEGGAYAGEHGHAHGHGHGHEHPHDHGHVHEHEHEHEHERADDGVGQAHAPGRPAPPHHGPAPGTGHGPHGAHEHGHGHGHGHGQPHEHGHAPRPPGQPPHSHG